MRIEAQQAVELKDSDVKYTTDTGSSILAGRRIIQEIRSTQSSVVGLLPA
jgi:hypothetical protein